MTVIVDTNIVIAALIKEGIVRRIIAGNPGIWVMPDTCFEEIWEHRDKWNRSNISDDELREILDDFVEDFVILVSDEVYGSKMEMAEKLVNDNDDAPIVALCLAVENDGIWTFNPKHFRKSQATGIRLLTTRDITDRCKPMGYK